MSPRVRRLPILAFALLAAISMGACNKLSHPTDVDAENLYVHAGPLTYQVQLSRQLNPLAADDREFLSGVTGSQPTSSQIWFGIWLWAKNQTSSNQTTTNTFAIVDSAGDKYYPVPINGKMNPFAWNAETLAPKQIEPAPGTAAQQVPPQGGLILFKLNNTIFSNRPLTLQIYAKGQSKPSTVSLDL